jgi:hypothetical protein
MTQTCLPIEAYYHINRNTPRVQPRFQAPGDPKIEGLLVELGAWVARTPDWEAAFRLTFGDEAFEEDYPAIDWSAPAKVRRKSATQVQLTKIAENYFSLANTCCRGVRPPGLEPGTN